MITYFGRFSSITEAEVSFLAGATMAAAERAAIRKMEVA